MPTQEEIDRGDFVEPVEDVMDDEDEELEEEELEDEEETEEDESDSEDEEDEDDDEEDSEEDDEEEDDDSEEDEEDSEEDEEEDEEDIRIPKSRLDQVVAQREEERERNKWLQEQLEAMIQRQTGMVDDEEDDSEEDPGPPEFDFDEAESRYIELILEGEVKDAAALRREINKASDAIRDYQIDHARKAAAEDALTETTSSLDDQRFNALLNTYTKEHDFLNDESDAYNAKAVTMANKLMASYLAEGQLKSEALKSAVEDILPLFEKGEEPAPEAKAKTTARKKTARRKAAKASKAQPPSTKSGKGRASRNLDSFNIEKASDKEFNSLTKKELAKLRGDIL